jgi:hypothetical protein
MDLRIDDSQVRNPEGSACPRAAGAWGEAGRRVVNAARRCVDDALPQVAFQATSSGGERGGAEQDGD